MLEFQSQRSYLDPNSLQEIFEIYRSVNENMMSYGEFPTQLADAFVVGCKEQGRITLYVYYFLHESQKGLLFQETDPLTPQNYPEKRKMILESIEAMGFIMNNLGYRNLPNPEREKLLATLKVFQAEPKGKEPEKKDPETILILEDEEHTEAPKTKSPQLDANLWGVLFRTLASL